MYYKVTFVSLHMEKLTFEREKCFSHSTHCVSKKHLLCH